MILQQIVNKEIIQQIGYVAPELSPVPPVLILYFLVALLLQIVYITTLQLEGHFG